MVAATTSENDLLTTEEACQYVRVTRPTLLAMVRKHKIQRVEMGKRNIGGRNVPALVRYRRRELDRMIDRSSKQLR